MTGTDLLPDPDSADAVVAAAVSGPPGRFVVQGGPGTGKTALLQRIARAALDAGTPADRILVLVHSGQAAAEFTGALAGAGATGLVSTEPLVRTVHSLAYGVLRLAAARDDAPAPRLLTGAEHDAIIRDTLVGEATDGGTHWPSHLRPALGTVGFARELRELLLRSVERGIYPEQLGALGARAQRPEWTAAARFFARHEQEMQLRSGPQVDGSTTPVALYAPELVGTATELLEGDPELLAGYRDRDIVLVDDAHLLDPAASEFITRIGGGADHLVVAEDLDQSTYRFRGATGELARFVLASDGTKVVLRDGHRMAPAVERVAARIAERLPGDPGHRPVVPAAEDPDATDAAHGAHASGAAAPVDAAVGPPAGGVVQIRELATPAAEAAAVADFLRRRHLHDGVPWSDMAVLYRGGSGLIDELTYAFDAAGVPVVDAGAEIPPTHDPVVAALLAVVESVTSEPGPDVVAALLAGPIGRADPLALRSLRRGLRREFSESDPRPSVEILRDLVLGEVADVDHALARLSEIESKPIERVRKVRAAVRDALDRGDLVDEVLWAAWQAARLEHRLSGQARASDSWARQANRSLDAAIALFEFAGDYVDRVPTGSIAGFVDFLTALDLPAARRADTRTRPEAVSILSAHSAVGREWEAVAVCGVQDGTWPAPPRRSGILKIDEFVDITERFGAGGPDPDEPMPSHRELSVAAAGEKAAEERRLFYLATSRARAHLLVTAVTSSGEGEAAASRFVDEIADLATGDPERAPAADPHVPVVLGLDHLVAELRATLEGSVDTEERNEAAALLATLAADDVPGADPAEWYHHSGDLADGVEPQSRSLSPSAFETIENCALRWFLGRFAGDESDGTPLVQGSFVHLLAQAVEGGVSSEDITAIVEHHWPQLTSAKGWFTRREITRILDMVEGFRDWHRASRGTWTVEAVEAPMDLRLSGDRGEVTVHGRLDRLERDDQGRLTPVDLKTGNAVSGKDAEVHPQLALYQLGVRLGALKGMDGPAEPGGGELVFVKVRNQSGTATRGQAPLGEDDAVALTERVFDAAESVRGPHYLATTGDWCSHCPVRPACPAHDEGKGVV